jgi:hypothetical protein
MTDLGREQPYLIYSGEQARRIEVEKHDLDGKSVQMRLFNLAVSCEQRAVGGPHGSVL